MSTENLERACLLAVHPVLMSSDVRTSIAFFKGLGFGAIFVDDETNPRYAALRRDATEIHVQWNEIPKHAEPHDLPTYRFLVTDVDTLYLEFRGNAPAFLASPNSSPWHAPADTPWGTREFHLRDPDGNGLQFYRQASALAARDGA